jgi:hypothetical protein
VTWADRQRLLADLEWLLARPDLPDEFRRAAAVHLERST